MVADENEKEHEQRCLRHDRREDPRRQAERGHVADSESEGPQERMIKETNVVLRVSRREMMHLRSEIRFLAREFVITGQRLSQEVQLRALHLQLAFTHRVTNANEPMAVRTRFFDCSVRRGSLCSGAGCRVR